MADGKTTIEIRLRSAADVSGVNQMQQAVRGLEGAQQRAAASSGNMGNALLQGSRALQDLQYGLAGAVNNLEGIASAMGLGAGAAGAVTVLAVAVQTLGPGVVEWLKSLDKEGMRLDELKVRMETLSKAILGDYSGAKDNAKQQNESFVKSLDSEIAALEKESKALNAQLELLKQRQAIQKTADQQKVEADIADIRAQGLPKEQEAAAIASKKKQALDAEKARQEEAAKAELEAQVGKVNAGAQERDAMAAKRKALEEERARAIEYARVAADQGKLEKEAAEKRRAAGALEASGVYNEDIGREVARAEAAAKANRERGQAIVRGAPQGRIRGVDEIDRQLGEVTSREEAARKQLAQDADELRRKADAEKQAKVGRDNTYQREAVKIAREQRGGVFDPANVQPAPFGNGALFPPLAPASGLPQPVGGKPAGLGELNFQGATQAVEQGTDAVFPPLGTAPASGLPQPVGGNPAGLGEVDFNKPTQAVEQGTDAVLSFAEAITVKQETLAQRLKALEEKVKGSR